MIYSTDTPSRDFDEPSMRGTIDSAAKGSMTNEDIASLAIKLAQSTCSTPIGAEQRTADLASTGGPSSLSTVLGPLYLRSLGWSVPKLGVPGRPAGGVDILAQVPGYQIRLTRKEVKKCIERCGYVHFLADESHAPLDARFFRFRQTVGAQNLPDLAIGSILAKKVAVGLERAGLDVRVAPHGNFGTTWEEARRNGRRFESVASILGIDAKSILTDGTNPYQGFVGRGEALLALRQLFRGDADPYLTSHALQCLAMAILTADSKGTDAASVLQHCKTHFFENLCAQGSCKDAFEEYTELIERRHSFHLQARREGVVDVQLDRIRDIVVHYQRFEAPEGTEFPDEMGIVLKRWPGDMVKAGDLLATVRAPEGQWPAVEAGLHDAIGIRRVHGSRLGCEEVYGG